MNQNTIIRLVIEEAVRKLPQEQQDKANALAVQILEIASQGDEGAMALALASAKFAEAND